MIISGIAIAFVRKALITVRQNPYEVTETVNDWGFMRQRRMESRFHFCPEDSLKRGAWRPDFS